MDGEPVVVRLAADEVAPVARAVTAGLAALAASGRRPDQVSWDAVREGPQGWHLDVARLVLVTGRLDADDVRDWAAALLVRCPADAPALLLRVLRTCQAERPESRPDAAELARLVAAATRSPRREARPPWRWLALLAVVAAGLPAAWVAGQALRPGIPQPSAPSHAAPDPWAPTPAPASTATAVPSPVVKHSRAAHSPKVVPPAAVSEWAAVLGALDRARAAWWAEPGDADLATVDLLGSPAWRADRAVVARLRGARVHAEGVATVVENVREVARGPGWVRLAVVDRRRAYRLVDVDGQVRERVDARGPVTWQVRLAEVDGRWRVEQVSRTRQRPSPSARPARHAAPARTSGAPR